MYSYTWGRRTFEATSLVVVGAIIFLSVLEDGIHVDGRDTSKIFVGNRRTKINIGAALAIVLKNTISWRIAADAPMLSIRPDMMAVWIVRVGCFAVLFVDAFVLDVVVMVKTTKGVALDAQGGLFFGSESSLEVTRIADTTKIPSDFSGCH